MSKKVNPGNTEVQPKRVGRILKNIAKGAAVGVVAGFAIIGAARTGMDVYDIVKDKAAA